eukprot:gene21606-28606_t
MPTGLKVWPVTKTVTYGFDPMDAPLDMKGTHLPPAQFHKAMANPNSIMIGARNFNKAPIGMVAPPPRKEGVKNYPSVDANHLAKRIAKDNMRITSCSSILCHAEVYTITRQQGCKRRRGCSTGFWKPQPAGTNRARVEAFGYFRCRDYALHELGVVDSKPTTMPAARRLQPRSVWDADEVFSEFEAAGIKPMHAVKLWSYLLRNPTQSWHDVPEFPKAAMQLLDSKFAKFTSTVNQVQRSDDGETVKMLISLQGEEGSSAGEPGGDSNRGDQTLGAEAVSSSRGSSDSGDSCDSFHSANSTICSHRERKKGNRGHRRATLCVSSQVGCQMGCSFCATGTMGLKGNLSTGEILEQLVHAHYLMPIRNIVFMGMGEPLNNYDAVRTAVSMMTHSEYFGLSRKQVTISTVGIIPRIKQLAEDLPGISLALSLHASNQELRTSIVPSAKAYHLDKLMDAVKHFEASSKQKVFVEYVMLSGVNDGQEQAEELGALLQDHNVVLNLIPYNPVYSPGMSFKAPTMEAVTQFQSTLRIKHGIPTTVRQEKGQDIAGACGQLVISSDMKDKANTVGKASGCSGGDKLADIEDY